MFYVRKFWFLYVLMTVIICLAVVLGDRTVSAWAENSEVTRSHIFIIDAGHGGEDGGAVSCTGVPESQINLEIALRLDSLMHLLGCETRMIRTTDISVYTEGKTIAAKKASDLRNRVKLVNQTHNSILISIHQNIYPDSQYRGAQVFYNQQGEGKQLAVALQSVLVSSLAPESHRQIKPSTGIYLMENCKKPAVLVECGFLSNPEEEKNLRTGTYQKKLCCVIAATTAQFFSS